MKEIPPKNVWRRKKKKSLGQSSPNDHHNSRQLRKRGGDQRDQQNPISINTSCQDAKPKYRR